MPAPLQVPDFPGGPAVQPFGVLALLALCVVVGWLVYRDAKRHEISYAWQTSVGVAALLFAGLLPGIVALAVYFVFLRR